MLCARKKHAWYQVYVHLCQVSSDILYGKYTCKAGVGCCCKHGNAALCQLVEY